MPIRKPNRGNRYEQWVKLFWQTGLPRTKGSVLKWAQIHQHRVLIKYRNEMEYISDISAAVAELMEKFKESIIGAAIIAGEALKPALDRINAYTPRK